MGQGTTGRRTWRYRRFFQGISDALCEAVRRHVRYDYKDPNGETRRDRNERFGVDNPEPPQVPEDFEYVWEWFWELVETGRHVQEGVPNSFTHVELKAWKDNMGQLVNPDEMKMIIAMSKAWADELGKEFENWRAIEEENRKRKSGVK